MTITKSGEPKKYYFLVQSAALGLYRELYDEPNVQVYSSYENSMQKVLNDLCYVY